MIKFKSKKELSYLIISQQDVILNSKKSESWYFTKITLLLQFFDYCQNPMYSNVSFSLLPHWSRDDWESCLALRWCTVVTNKRHTKCCFSLYILLKTRAALLTDAWSNENRMSKVETSNDATLDALACANRCNDRFINNAVAYSSWYKFIMRHLSCRWLISHSSKPLSIMYIRCWLRRDSFCNIATIMSHPKGSTPSM